VNELTHEKAIDTSTAKVSKLPGFTSFRTMSMNIFDKKITDPDKRLAQLLGIKDDDEIKIENLRIVPPASSVPETTHESSIQTVHSGPSKVKITDETSTKESKQVSSTAAIIKETADENFEKQYEHREEDDLDLDELSAQWQKHRGIRQAKEIIAEEEKKFRKSKEDDSDIKPNRKR